MSQAIISVNHLTMAYHEKPVLWDVSLDIMENSITAIIGPNGAGKSTLIKGILDLEKTLSGQVKIMGQDFKEVHKKIAYIPQTSSVNWDFPTTVEDVVLMGRYVHLGWLKRPSQADRKKAEEALAMIGLSDYKKRQISQLSGGQRQRVFIARAIAQDADIYFMDEPLAGVDKRTEKIIIDFLRDAQSQGKTSIVVHHDLNTIRDYFDHLVILNKQVIAQGPVETSFTAENLVKADMLAREVAGVYHA
ncbi:MULTISPECIES: metal ABC transporter ATP-binding protein [Aerococcus]|uniref:Metal ABC transporter ATP-binding protein n=1 Tax=Aerococcus sanguinicola TaxID=119206 RepID=A0A5N1GQ07_9LACT|nr:MULTISPECIES: metal ABC transporter ATP-binding protein [Aerococcus]KAA9302339.1 metal ABC transporter ATP-binding protein [Aerococcus sanguinicola]MDK6370019.1 metal ABC transporter ATP-binding protein [Aerococcus sp. UMB9870]MDK6678996.1 metal ABC transporter ATP-binding protein [Aerococcus sp. UMB8608]MDK6687533.1 metal ABC transporter ATP-binding protein [Aerococcus sp. UMB8623]MDK6939655.1 metal ABC transporter ATP-binding protein [Aerococcus sp. UMB8487]